MQIDQYPSNILKLLASEGSSSLSAKFTQQLNLGQFLKGQVIQIFSQGKSLVQFGGQKILVEGNSSFRVGQTLTAQVEQLAPAPVLKIVNAPSLGSANRANPGAAVNDPAGSGVKQEVTLQLSSKPSTPISFFSQPNLEFLKLSPGTVYQGQVKQVLDPEAAVIQLNDRKFLVQTDGSKPLKPGDQIPVAAERTASGPYHLLQSKGPVITQVDAGMIKPYLPSREPFGEMINKLAGVLRELAPGSEISKTAGKEVLARLTQTLQSLTAGSQKSPTPQIIKEQIHLSGIDYEAKVKQFLETGSNSGKGLELGRDLKGLLLEIIQKMEAQGAQKSLPAPASQAVKDIMQIFRQAADNIELHQLSNQLAKQEGQPLLLQIPNPYAHGDSSIKLFVRSATDEDGKKGKSRQNFNLVFILDLSNLGNLRVDSQVKQSSLSIKMTTQNQSIADYIASQTEGFEGRLAELGFQADLSCCVQDEKDLKLEDDLPEILAKDEFRLVDVTT
ncbi:MAG: hypothetical protein NPINA01_12370 [Nitrospinaceae bacterium]|nr:MAG: hypothetical protein NPINA01_12370 [Nitrospinaceae bacterium]